MVQLPEVSELTITFRDLANYFPQIRRDGGSWCTVDSSLTHISSTLNIEYSAGSRIVRLGYTLEPACKVHGCKVFSDVWSILGRSQSKSARVGYNPDVRSDRLYGQISLDKMLTLQAGATVPSSKIYVKRGLQHFTLHIC